MKPNNLPVQEREMPHAPEAAGTPQGAHEGSSAPPSVPREHCSLRGYVHLAWEHYRRAALRFSAAAALTALLILTAAKVVEAVLPVFVREAAILYAESWFIAGFSLFVLSSVSGRGSSYWTLLYAQRLPRAALVVFFQLLLTIAGMLLFVVPAVIFNVVYSLALFLYLEERAQTVLGALQESARVVRGKFWRVAAALSLLFLLLLAGLMVAGVGAVITLPLSTLGFYFLYRCLLDEYDRAPAHGTSWLARNTIWLVTLLVSFALLFLIVVVPLMGARGSMDGAGDGVPVLLREHGTA